MIPLEKGTIVSRSLRRLAAVVLPATVMFAGIAVVPASSASAKTVAHWATFQGEVDRGGRSGVAGDNPGTPTIENGTCTDAGSGATDTSCSVAFSIDRSICTVEPGKRVNGWGSYTSSTNSSVYTPLFGVGELGSGVLEGRQTIIATDGRPWIVHIVIDAGDFCGALLLAGDLSSFQVDSQVRTGGFNGHVDLIAA